ncbi:hypothetical protein A2U01_0035931, partial [Trifolium medium]|nr:hypothetical protein [Trifolium medium]
MNGGFLSSILDIESSFQRHQQTQLGNSSGQQDMNIITGLENKNQFDTIEVKNLNMGLTFGKGKGIASSNPDNSNDMSEDDEPGYAEDGNCENFYDGGKGKKGGSSPWQRMKWTDNVVGLLIAVVSCVGDDG